MPSIFNSTISQHPVLDRNNKETKSQTHTYRERGREGETDLEVGGGDGNEKGGGGPEKSAESNDMGTVVTHSQVSGKWVTRGLHNGSEQSERAQPSWVSVKSSPYLLVHPWQH